MLDRLFDSVPEDLVDYFARIADGSFEGRDELELSLLPLSESVRWSEEFREFHPVVIGLGGVVLDDPNTSNHHVYLSHDVCRGAIFFLDHDGDSRVVFASASDFLDAAREVLRTGRPLREFHPPGGVLLPDQVGLARLVEELRRGEFDGDCGELLLALIPSLAPADTELFRALAADDDFYVVQALADVIAARPRSELKGVAEICRGHGHPQAARAGERALAAIRLLD